MRGNTYADNIIILDVYSDHETDVTAESLSKAFKGDHRSLAVKYADKETPFNLSILYFKTVNDGVVG